ncbi:MAG: ABC transporter permease [Jejuia sp.]
MSPKKTNEWLYTISAKKSVLSLNFKEVWQYRDLLLLFVKRDVITTYKQTILGPLWYFIQPLFTSVIFTLIFNTMANVPTGDGVPPFLFNLAGITLWNYFKVCFTGTSSTFSRNQNIFGKVYFPRVIMPLSTVISNLLRLGIQGLVFIGFYVFYKYVKDASITPALELLLFPFLILVMALLGLGFGMLITSLTTKYRDLNFLLQFGVQLLMYGSAVMYPISFFKEKIPSYAYLIEYNPIAIIIDVFRYVTLGSGLFSFSKIVYAVMFSLIIFFLGLLVFNRTEKNFIDTV